MVDVYCAGRDLICLMVGVDDLKVIGKLKLVNHWNFKQIQMVDYSQQV